jgi:hypothetical protein
MMRKKRNDRNYILYSLTVNGESYIGLTVANGRAYWKALKLRVQKHISRAVRENKDWNLYKAMSAADTVEYTLLEVVRGRGAAYIRERQLIAEYAPELNTF